MDLKALPLNVRITSTYVEKTIAGNIQLVSYKDHLHIRGENARHNLWNGILEGSPPHTWRKLPAASTSLSLVGITSTYVEKTTNHSHPSRRKEDHLHIRGENNIHAW